MMRNVWAVARREVRGYFDQPTAYVLVVAFLGITLFLAYRSLYAMGVASLRPIFDLLPLLFAVFVPAATMRSLAEERRSRP
jgi:ABC-2 type transport system permease protein